MRYPNTKGMSQELWNALKIHKAAHKWDAESLRWVVTDSNMLIYTAKKLPHAVELMVEANMGATV